MIHHAPAPNNGPPRQTQETRGPIVVAVSGGSDSVALLYWLVENLPDRDLHVVTVDHRLRAASRLEAVEVARLCEKLGLPHTTLVWTRPNSTAANAARETRYTLMHELARKLGSDIIALGHTLDDQAETVLMRALRTRQNSDTRGLSGMSEWSSFHGVRLWRPLLKLGRDSLRHQLQEKNIGWIDDPTNLDEKYERVRARKALTQTASTFPAPPSIARLAELCARSRYWLSKQVAACLTSQARRLPDGGLQLSTPQDLPLPVLREAIVTLILAAGGLAFRVQSSKLDAIVQHLRSGAVARHTLGRCLIITRTGQLEIEREMRNLPLLPDEICEATSCDGRWLLQPGVSGGNYEKLPYICALEAFRPDFDDPIYAAVVNLLNA